MKNTSIIIAISILIILSGFAIAYKEEIKEFSNEAIQNYIIGKMQTLSQEQQEDFNNFKELNIDDKLIKAFDLNQQKISERQASDYEGELQ